MNIMTHGNWNKTLLYYPIIVDLFVLGVFYYSNYINQKFILYLI